MDDSSENKTTQKNVTARIVSGRDTKVIEVHYHIKPDRLQYLYSKLSAEIEQELQTAAVTPSLERFTATSADEVIGLSKKLEDGSLACQLDYAIAAKEDYVKNLTRFQMYESAQKIHALFLSVIESRFNRFIKPKLSTADQETILNLVQEKIVDQIADRLGTNPMDLCDREIDGMLYFLTGKCMLSWKN